MILIFCFLILFFFYVVVLGLLMIIIIIIYFMTSISQQNSEKVLLFCIINPKCCNSWSQTLLINYSDSPTGCVFYASAPSTPTRNHLESPSVSKSSVSSCLTQSSPLNQSDVSFSSIIVIPCVGMSAGLSFPGQNLQWSNVRSTWGHFGITKTMERVSERFYWKGMVADVRDMVNHSNYILPFFMPVVYI